MPQNTQMSLDEKIELLTYGIVGYPKESAYLHSDFPAPIGIAASFDTEVMFSFGQYSAEKAESKPFVLSPPANPNVDPRYGSMSCCLGEDPLLSGNMTAAFAVGVLGGEEESPRAIPIISGCFTGSGCEESSSVPAALKRDYYLKPFETAIKSGTANGVFISRGKVNGIEQRRSPEISTIAKSEWGALFTAADGRGLADDSDYSDNLAKIIKNGSADIVCGDPEVMKLALREALESGKITEKDIDKTLEGLIEARERIIEEPAPSNDSRAALRAAEESVVLLRNNELVLPFDRKEPITVVGYFADLCFGGSGSTVLDSIVALCGRENVSYEPGNDIVALRNADTGFYFYVNDDDTMICGAPLINERCLFDLYDWGGKNFSLRSRFTGKFIGDGETMECVQSSEPGIFTLVKNGGDYHIKHRREGYMNITSDGRVTANGRLKPSKNSLFHIEIFSSGIDRVCRAVTETHNVAVFCGNNPISERNGVMRIPDSQQRIAEKVVGLNRHTALFLITGTPCEVLPKFNTVIWIPHGGLAISTAAAGAMFGEFSPAGRCPVTWYASESDLSDVCDRNIIRAESTYRYFGGKPLFPFGYGLSYTSFRYGAIRLNKTEFSAGERVEVTFEVSNIGKFASDEVVQLYSTAPRFARSVPLKELRAFKRIHIEAGEEATVTLSFAVDELAMWDINENRFKLLGGDYTLQTGCSSADIMRTCEIKINGEDYRGIDVAKSVSAAVSYDYIGAEFRTDSEFEEYVFIKDSGSIVFEDCFLNGEGKLEITAANPSSAVTVTVVRTDIQAVVASVEIPHTGGAEHFVKVTADLCRIDGICGLKFSVDGTLSFKSFKMLKEKR